MAIGWDEKVNFGIGKKLKERARQIQRQREEAEKERRHAEVMRFVRQWESLNNDSNEVTRQQDADPDTFYEYGGKKFKTRAEVEKYIATEHAKLERLKAEFKEMDELLTDHKPQQEHFDEDDFTI